MPTTSAACCARRTCRGAAAKDLPPEQLRAIEDRAIKEIIAFQEDVGLPVVTDGEFRRRFFFSTVEFLVDGIDP